MNGVDLRSVMKREVPMVFWSVKPQRFSVDKEKYKGGVRYDRNYRSLHQELDYNEETTANEVRVPLNGNCQLCLIETRVNGA